MELIDKTTIQSGAINFIVKKFSEFDLSKLEYVKLLTLTKNTRYHGFCKYPKRTVKGARTFIHQYRICCSINEDDTIYPYVEEETIGTHTHACGNGWDYVYEQVVYANREELLVFLAGHEAFYFLRHSQQVPGQQSETQANVFGIKWLQEYRNPPSKEKEAVRFINDFGENEGKFEIDEETCLFKISTCYNNPESMLKELKTGYIPALKIRGSILTLKKMEQ